MKFVEAMRHMLNGGKVTSEFLIVSDYLYINEEDKIVNQHGYQIAIDVNSDNWVLVEEDK